MKKYRLLLLYMLRKVLNKAFTPQISDVNWVNIRFFSTYESREICPNISRLVKKYIVIFIVSGLFILKINNGYATTQRTGPDYQRNCLDLEMVQKNTPGLVLLKGEICKINSTEILMTSLSGDNKLYRLKLVSNTRFFCNGIESQWEALLPVVPGAYFEAQVLVNAQREAIMISAFYLGEECVVKKCYQNKGKLIVELISVISDENYSYPLNETARLPTGDNWKQEGQIVFVLYNRLEEIRAVFLPD